MPVWTEDSGSTTNYLDKQIDLESGTTYRIKNSSSTDLFTISESTGAISLVGSVTFGSDIVNNLIGNVTGNLTGNVTGNLTGNVTGDLTGDSTGNLTGNVTGDVTGNIISSGTSSFANIDINGGTIDGATITHNTISGNTINNNVTGDITGSNWTGNLTVSGDLTVNGNDINFGGSQDVGEEIDANILFSRNQNDSSIPTLRIKAINTYPNISPDVCYVDLTTETDGVNTLKSYTTKAQVGVRIIHDPSENPNFESGDDVNANIYIDAVRTSSSATGWVSIGSQGGLNGVAIGDGNTASSPYLTFNASAGQTFNVWNRVGIFAIGASVDVFGLINYKQDESNPYSTLQSSGDYAINNGLNGTGTNVALFNSSLAKLSGDIQVDGGVFYNSAGDYVIQYTGTSNRNLMLAGDLVISGNGISGNTGATAININGTNVDFVGDIKIGGDNITNSSDETVFSFASGKTTADNDILLGQNRLKNSEDNAVFTFSGVDTTIVGDLTISGGNITNAITFDSGITDTGQINAGEWRGTAIADGYISSAATWNAKQDALTFGIANNNAVEIDAADVAEDDYAMFTADGLKGMSASEVLSDIGAQASLTFGIANTNALKVDEPDGGYTASSGDIAQFTSTGIKGVNHVSAIGKDEDNMASNSDTHFPTQQSVKAYVDNHGSGAILGYTRIGNDGTTGGDNTITMDSTMTVLQTVDGGTDVGVTFNAPASGNVEIEFTGHLYTNSTTVALALSSDTTFTEVAETQTYDAGVARMDETDQHTIVVTWVITGLTAGQSYSYYIAGEETSSSTSYFNHGRFRTTGTHFPPLIVKATALPATITTGD